MERAILMRRHQFEGRWRLRWYELICVTKIEVTLMSHANKLVQSWRTGRLRSFFPSASGLTDVASWDFIFKVTSSRSSFGRIDSTRRAAAGLGSMFAVVSNGVTTSACISSSICCKLCSKDHRDTREPEGNGKASPALKVKTVPSAAAFGKSSAACDKGSICARKDFSNESSSQISS